MSTELPSGNEQGVPPHPSGEENVRPSGTALPSAPHPSGTAPPGAPHRAGFISIIGRPNAGKSTLLNALLGRKLSIVSARPQTTRHKVLGILNGEGYQACFHDTPGWLEKADDGLQRMLMRMARSAVRDDADVLVLVVDPSLAGPAEVEHFGFLASVGRPLILAVNKVDVFAPEAVEKTVSAYARLNPAATYRVSAMKKTGVRPLLDAVLAFLPESPAYYGKNQMSDRWERFFASELIREAIFELYRAEIPHACAVEIEDYRERPGMRDSIRAVVYVEKQTQKGILLGAKGSAIRRLSEASLRRIEEFLGRGAELDLWVKVRPGWRKNGAALQEFGYTL